ncbi:MAG: CoA transferase [Burkholderiaceae bacterium]
MLAEAGRCLRGDGRGDPPVSVVGRDTLPSCFAATDLAVASIAAAGTAVAELLELSPAFRSGPSRRGVTVDQRLACGWFLRSIRPVGWTMAESWDAIAGDYRTRDGWIRLHTNAPHHRAAALAVLGCDAERSAVARAVERVDADELERAIVQARGCAAAMRSLQAWHAHPQGVALRAEPLIATDRRDASATPSWRPDPRRPLAGIRVLDLTRVLAGPVATRVLAGLGAEVLRIDPPDWNEPSLVPDVTLGKRCARLDLRRPADRQVFEALLARADVVVHGYRPGALDGLGYGPAQRRAINPDTVDVSLCAYGWSGPWAGRRGFDSLVQMSAGIAEAGMRWREADRPVPLPAQALDHATGYLMAAAAIRGIGERVRDGRVLQARLSLARTAMMLTTIGAGDADRAGGGDSDVGTGGDVDTGGGDRREDRAGAQARPAAPPAFTGVADDDFDPRVEATPWGEARRLRPPLSIGDVELRWDRPAATLGSSPARWLE